MVGLLKPLPQQWSVYSSYDSATIQHQPCSFYGVRVSRRLSSIVVNCRQLSSIVVNSHWSIDSSIADKLGGRVSKTCESGHRTITHPCVTQALCSYCTRAVLVLYLQCTRSVLVL